MDGAGIGKVGRGGCGCGRKVAHELVVVESEAVAAPWARLAEGDCVGRLRAARRESGQRND
jgi:hypothetical protein